LYESENSAQAEAFLLSDLMYYFYDYGRKNSDDFNLLALELTVKINPKNIWASIDLAEFYRRKGDYKKSLEILEKAEENMEEIIKERASDEGFRRINNRIESNIKAIESIEKISD
jgi:lipopolysaccharide biosynthesis regulator YciM